MRVSCNGMRSFCKHSCFLDLSVVVVVGHLSASPLLARFDKDFSTWQALGFTFYEDDTWRIKAAAQTRWYDDSSFLATWFVHPILEYKFHPNLDIGATYLFEDLRAQAGNVCTRFTFFASTWPRTGKLTIESVFRCVICSHCAGLSL